MLRITPVIGALIIINILVFFIDELLFKGFLSETFALRHFTGSEFNPIQIFGYMFLHADLGHLLMNMLSMYLFGVLLEYYWGGQRFLFYYLFCVVGAVLLHSGVAYFNHRNIEQKLIQYEENPSYEAYLSFARTAGFELDPSRQSQIEEQFDDPQWQAFVGDQMRKGLENLRNSRMVGASGGVFGLIMAMGLLFPNRELRFLFFPIPIKVKYLVFLYIGSELYLSFLSRKGDLIAHTAHLGGALFGFLLIKYWQRSRKNFY